MVIDKKVAVRDIDAAALTARLRGQHAVMEPPMRQARNRMITTIHDSEE